MNLYAMNAQMSNSSNVATFEKGLSYYLSIGRNIVMILIFVAGLLLVLKRIKVNRKNSIVKIISFLIPILGIVMFFIYRKSDNKEAKEYLKIALTGIVTYILMFLVVFITFLIMLFGITAG